MLSDQTINDVFKFELRISSSSADPTLLAGERRGRRLLSRRPALPSASYGIRVIASVGRRIPEWDGRE